VTSLSRFLNIKLHRQQARGGKLGALSHIIFSLKIYDGSIIIFVIITFPSDSSQSFSIFLYSSIE